MSDICVGRVGHHWFRPWLDSFSVPRLHLNPFLLTVNWANRCGPVTPYDGIDMDQHWSCNGLNCLVTPGYYLIQSWLIASETLWHSSRAVLLEPHEIAQYSSPWYELEHYWFNNMLLFFRSQWVKYTQWKSIEIELFYPVLSANVTKRVRCKLIGYVIQSLMR